MNFQTLYYAASNHPNMGQNSNLQHTAAKVMWETELRERFERFRAELNRLGYKRVHIGGHPRSSFGPNNHHDNMVFADPPTRTKEGRVALWQGVCDIMGGMSCGNGHDAYDQAQLLLPPGAFSSLAGEHEL